MDNTCQYAEINWAAQDDISNLEKLTQSYLSLKKRICSAHEVITQYNDKVKECDRLKSELKVMTKQAKKATFDYNTTLAKVLKVELQNTEYQKKVQTLTATVENQEVKIAADSKHIQQLTCKINNIEIQNTEKVMEYDLEKSLLQVRIKDLEQELKNAKRPHESQMRKMEKKLNTDAAKPKFKIPTKSTVDVAVNTAPKYLADVAVNTTLKSTVDTAVNTAPIQNFIRPKPKLSDKCVMTREFYNIKDNDYPVFCGKCQIEIIPPPLDKICQIMQDQCPLPVERIRSPSPMRASSPLPRAHDITVNQCKAENLSDTCSQTNDRANRNSYPLTSTSPIAPLQATYFNDFIPQPVSNLINQSKYYIPITANAHLNQNNGAGITAFNSSLSVIESLEKRIGTLETKVKKQLKKRKAMENSNCWQHKHPTSCCSHEIGNTSQSNVTLDLMQKMLEMCNRSQVRDIDIYKEHMLANLSKPKVKKTSRKKKKRLQSAAKPIWKVESMPKVTEQPYIQTKMKTKKRKLLTLFGSHDRQTLGHEHCSTSADTSLNLESAPNYVKSVVYSSCETSPSAKCKTLRQSVKPIKSLSNETDSGLSSDCVESCRVAQCETDTETCSTVGEDRGHMEEGETNNSEQGETFCHSSVNEPSESMEYSETDNSSVSKEDIGEKPEKMFDAQLPADTENICSLHNQNNSGTTEPLSEHKNYEVIKNTSFISEDRMEEKTMETLDIHPLSDTEERDLPHDQDDCNTLTSQIVPTISAIESSSEYIEYHGKKESSTSEEYIEERSEERLDIQLPVDTENTSPLRNEDDFDTIVTETVPKRNITEASPEHKKYSAIKDSSCLSEESITEDLPDDQGDCGTTGSQTLSTRSIVESSSDDVEYHGIKESSVSKEHYDDKPVETLGIELHSDTELYDEEDCDTTSLETMPKRRGRPPKKKSGNRQELLKKLRNLKKSKGDVAIHPSLTENPNLRIDEPDNCDDKLDADVKTEVYTPRKRTRIAHTPKHTLLDSDPKPVVRINLYEREYVNGHETVTRQTVPNSQGILDSCDSQEAPISGRTRSCRINTRKRKISDITEEFNVISTKTVKTVCESNCLNSLNGSGESTNSAMNSATPEKVLDDLKNVIQKDINVETQVLNLDCNAEKLIDTCTGTTSISDSTLEDYKPLIKECINSIDASDHSINDSSLCKYELQSSQVESNLHVSDLKTESRGPLCINELRMDANNENDGIKPSQNCRTSMESYATEESADELQHDTAKDSGAGAAHGSSQQESPLTLVIQYSKKKKGITKATKKQKKNLAEIVRLTDEFIKKQLEKLIHSAWTLSIHLSVVEKLKTACSSRILAKCIIEFLCTENKYNTELDKTYTPPAPLMTKAQQRITPLLIDLNQVHPNIIELVQAGIQYELFRPRKTSHKRWLLMSLVGMYIALARVQKDREKMRIFCYDAMYFLHLNAMIVLYTVLTSWPEVLPNCTATNEVLPKCMAHVILSQQCAYPLPKLNALKNLISMFYQYPTGTVTKDILDELISKLQEKPYNGLESALILLAKRENTTWTHKNLIRGALLPLIICNKVPSQYRAFSLLGNLLRPFPKDDSSKTVGEIAEQLRDLINSGEMEFEQQEGIIAALLSLSRQNDMFDMIAETVIKWKPSQSLCWRTKEQVKAFLRLRDPRYWMIYLKRQELALAQTIQQKVPNSFP